MAKQKQAEFLKWMGPCLDALRKLGGSGTPQEVSDTIADELNLPDEKREELTASGIPRFHNQKYVGLVSTLFGRGILKAQKEVSGNSA